MAPKLVQTIRARMESERRRAAEWTASHESTPPFDVVLGVYRRDRDVAGSVVGSAIAFRLFLFFIPLLLFVVGVAGFLSGFVTARDVNEEAGFSGVLADQIRTALSQPGSSRWVAALLGLVGMATAGRALSKALWSASAVSWQVPVATRASFRVVGGVVGLVAGMSLIAIAVNKVREELGLAVASVSFLAALGVYLVAWFVIFLLLPRGTTDPGALLPGSIFLAATIAVMHAVSELYIPRTLGRASELYGAIGTTIVVLGWFFILGRAIVLAMSLNAVTYERLGSISTVLFALPGVRALPRRFPRLRTYFSLDRESGSGPDEAAGA